MCICLLLRIVQSLVCCSSPPLLKAISANHVALTQPGPSLLFKVPTLGKRGIGTTSFLVSLKWQLNVDPIAFELASNKPGGTRDVLLPGVTAQLNPTTLCDFRTRVRQPDGTRDVLLPGVTAQRQCRDMAIRGSISPTTSEGSFPPGQGVLRASSIYFRIDVLLPGAAAQRRSHDIARLSNSRPA